MYTAILILLIPYVVGNEDLIVRTSKGLVRGSIQQTPDGVEYLSFVGVPYASPPTGKLRLSNPIEHEPWIGIWAANGKGAGAAGACTQVDHDPPNAHGDIPQITGTEDCLHINLYIPVKAFKKGPPLPVVVHIHGGAFMFGRGDLYGPNHLMSHDVAYVTFNYRLGPLGFLSTEDEASPGNFGLKDQRMALKWLNQEAAAFGLDQNRITITGLSAGGASVHFHTISKSSSGLFRRAMSVSGTALANWAMVENPRGRAQRLAQSLGCPIDDSHEMVECLRGRPSTEIILAGKVLFQPWLYNPYTPWGPVVEPPGPDAFLLEEPYVSLARGAVNDVPWITSVTTHEGLYPAAEFLYKDHYLEHLDQNWAQLAKHVLHYEDTISGDEFELAERIKREYIGGRISLESFGDLVQLVGDRLFVAEAERAARMHARAIKSQVHFYVYGWRGSHSSSELLAKKVDDHGVCHADDVMYVLSPPSGWYTEYMVTEEDRLMRDQLVDMWVSFAKEGSVSFGGVQWDPVEPRQNPEEGQIVFLNISGPGQAEMNHAEHLGRRPFWDSLELRENQHVHDFHHKEEL